MQWILYQTFTVENDSSISTTGLGLLHNTYKIDHYIQSGLRHITLVVRFNFIGERWDLQFNIDTERQTFNFDNKKNICKRLDHIKQSFHIFELKQTCINKIMYLHDLKVYQWGDSFCRYTMYTSFKIKLFTSLFS